jgi:hypothetical protein
MAGDFSSQGCYILEWISRLKDRGHVPEHLLSEETFRIILAIPSPYPMAGAITIEDQQNHTQSTWWDTHKSSTASSVMYQQGITNCRASERFVDIILGELKIRMGNDKLVYELWADQPQSPQVGSQVAVYIICCAIRIRWR